MLLDMLDDQYLYMYKVCRSGELTVMSLRTQKSPLLQLRMTEVFTIDHENHSS